VICRSVYQTVCRSVTNVSPAKTAEPIDVPFRLWTWVGLRKQVLDGGAHWRIRLNRPCAAAMRPFVKLLRPLGIFLTMSVFPL